MNTSNITNYKPKEFAELLGVSVKTLSLSKNQYRPVLLTDGIHYF